MVSKGQRVSVVVVFRKAARNFAALIDDVVQSIEESVLKQKLFDRTCEGAYSGAGMNDSVILRICGFTVGQLERTLFRPRDSLLGFGVRIRIRFVSVKSSQEFYDSIRDRAVFLLNGNGNELPRVVELAGRARCNSLMIRRDCERAAPDELVEVRV